MKFTLRQLHIFLAVSEHENISIAANQLAMSQSAASGALKDLEQRYDVQLFDRIGKRLQLNELGRVLRPQVAALLDQADELHQDILKHDKVGKLHIGATMSIGNYLCVPLMADFIAQNPQAQPHLTVANTLEVAHLVESFQVDLGMVEGEVNHPDLVSIPWRQDELVIFASPDHPLASSKVLHKADILSAQWILREPGSGTRETFDHAVQKFRSQLTVRMELQHTEAIKRAVEANLGISCLSKVTLKEAFKRGSLVPLATPTLNLKRYFNFLIHRKKYRTQGMQNWIDLCGRFEI